MRGTTIKVLFLTYESVPFDYTPQKPFQVQGKIGLGLRLGGFRVLVKILRVCGYDTTNIKSKPCG